MYLIIASIIAAQSVEEYHTGAWTEEETSGAKSLWHHWIAI